MKKLLFICLALVSIAQAQWEYKDSVSFNVSTAADSIADVILSSRMFTYITADDTGSTAAAGGLTDTLGVYVYNRLLAKWVPYGLVNVITGVKESKLIPGSGNTRAWMVYRVGAVRIQIRLENYRNAHPSRKHWFTIETLENIQ